MTPAQLDVSGELAAALKRPAVVASSLLPGFHPGFPEDAYHYLELGVLSFSALEHLQPPLTPAHYFSWCSGADERPPTPALSFGKALHMRCLEPQRFVRTYVVAPDFGDCRYGDNKKKRDAWRAEHAKATILDNASGFATLGMIESIANHPVARPLLEGGEPELTLRWDDTTTGLPAKCRVDHYRRDLLTAVDVKSTLDASPEGFARSVGNFGYHRQDAHYERGFSTLQETIDHFLFVAVEKVHPFAVAVYELERDDVLVGEREVVRASRRLFECMQHNEWPAYSDRIQRLKLPPYIKEKT